MGEAKRKREQVDKTGTLLRPTGIRNIRPDRGDGQPGAPGDPGTKRRTPSMRKSKREFTTDLIARLNERRPKMAKPRREMSAEELAAWKTERNRRRKRLARIAQIAKVLINSLANRPPNR